MLEKVNHIAIAVPSLSETILNYKNTMLFVIKESEYVSNVNGYKSYQSLIQTTFFRYHD